MCLEGGRDWWLQITEALDNVQFMALVVTPNALKSEIVRKEWRYARQQGVCVYPIKGESNRDFNSIPRWMRDLTSRVEELIYHLDGNRPGFTNLEAAITRLKELLEDRDLLLVIDDLMKQNEAVALLGAGFENHADLPRIRNELNALAERLGEWPLLLKLVNGYLRKSAEHENRTLPDAAARAKQALDKRGLTYFDVRDSDQRNDAVAKTIGVSLDLLTEDERARYFELAIFPEDVEIRSVTLEKLWSRTGGLDEFDTDDLCVRLNRLSLLLDFDASKRGIRLHDVIRHYLAFHLPHPALIRALGVYFLRLVR